MKFRISYDQKQRLEDHFRKTGVKATEAIRRKIRAAKKAPKGQTSGPYPVLAELVLNQEEEAKLKSLTNPDCPGASEVVRRMIESLEV